MKNSIVALIILLILSFISCFKSKNNDEVVQPEQINTSNEIEVFQANEFYSIDIEYAILYSIDPKADSVEDMNELYYYSKELLGYDFIKDWKPIHSHHTATRLDQQKIFNLKSAIILKYDDLTNECLPIYRDALIFYDKKDIPKFRLAICFECEKAYLAPFNVELSQFALIRLSEQLNEYLQ